MLRTVSIVLGLLLFASPLVGGEHTKDSLETVRKRVAANEAILLDVRELSEWNAGHLERARLIPLSGMKTSKGVEKALEGLPRKTPIYVHCKSGGRCLIAGDLMRKHGLDARPLKAGYTDLLEAGFENANQED